MRPGFVVGVLAFGVIATAVIVSWLAREGIAPGRLLTVTLLLFGAFTLFPMGLGWIKAPGAVLMARGAERPVELRRAALVAVVLTVMSVVTFVVTVLIVR